MNLPDGLTGWLARRSTQSARSRGAEGFAVMCGVLARGSALVVVWALVVGPRASAQNAGVPDTVFFHGDILTGVRLTAVEHKHGPRPERVSAIAVGDGVVLATGTDAEMLALAGPVTEKVDLGGAFAMPGFNDAHTHMAAAGQQRLTVDLDNVVSLAAMQAKVKAYAATLGAGQWILGGGWDHTKWVSGKLPTRQDLDAVSGGHPLFLERTDGHIAVLNSAALAACGITGETKSPLGGAIDVDPGTHEPTGIVRDTALNLVRPHIPPPDAAMRRRALKVAMEDALAHGVTSVQDFSDVEDYRELMAMEREDAAHTLPVRWSEWLPFDLPVATLDSLRALQPANDPFLHTGMLKGFMDGSLGSRTAAMLGPYADDPGNSGLPRYEQGRLNAMAAERAEDGFQLGFHAIGDRANRMALDAYAAANRAEDTKNRKATTDCLAQFPEARRMPDACGQQALPLLSKLRRFRIEHAQVVAPEDFARFAQMHVIASMQPSHLLTDMAWAGERLGPERSKGAYAWRTFLDHGVTLAFGTDYPVESISPFRGLYSAMTRMNEAGTQTFEPEQKLSIEEALYAYTEAPAFAEFEEQQKGKLVAGYFADMVVLDRDLTRATPREVLGTRVLRTVVGGVTRYRAGADVPPGTRRAAPDGD